ncbi:MAG: trypsin-like peptidase domain-containing protein, partial [Oligoflexia bacterium]|nr:trypsin-like peptidase domain-containing protein [Oligoflexia bacterium]
MRTLIFLLLLTSSVIALPQQMEGVYLLELADRDGKIISKASGFTSGNVLFTSFHFLNSRLLEADKVFVTGSGNRKYDVSVIGYSELNDILLLEAPADGQREFLIAEKCRPPYFVAGFYRDTPLIIKSDYAQKTELRGVYRLPVYLKKGFSGSPLLDEAARVCGMVVLSSEQNASSVAVSYG